MLVHENADTVPQVIQSIVAGVVRRNDGESDGYQSAIRLAPQSGWSGNQIRKLHHAVPQAGSLPTHFRQLRAEGDIQLAPAGCPLVVGAAPRHGHVHLQEAGRRLVSEWQLAVEG